jgi:hypothetical protein
MPLVSLPRFAYLSMRRRRCAHTCKRSTECSGHRVHVRMCVRVLVYAYLIVGCACRIVAAPIAFSGHAIDSCTGVCMCYYVSPVSTRAMQRNHCEPEANIVKTCSPTYVSSPNAYHSHTLLRILGRVTLLHSSYASSLCLRGTHSAE